VASNSESVDLSGLRRLITLSTGDKQRRLSTDTNSFQIAAENPGSIDNARSEERQCLEIRPDAVIGLAEFSGESSIVENVTGPTGWAGG
jgi:hypothetical protein